MQQKISGKVLLIRTLLIFVFITLSVTLTSYLLKKTALKELDRVIIKTGLENQVQYKSVIVRIFPFKLTLNDFIFTMEKGYSMKAEKFSISLPYDDLFRIKRKKFNILKSADLNISGVTVTYKPETTSKKSNKNTSDGEPKVNPLILYFKNAKVKFTGAIKTHYPVDFEKVLNNDQKISLKLVNGNITTDTSLLDENMDKKLIQELLNIYKVNVDLDYKKDSGIICFNNLRYESPIVHMDGSFNAEVVSDIIDEWQPQTVSMNFSITPGSYTLYDIEKIGNFKLGTASFTVNTDLTGTDIKNITSFPFSNINFRFNNLAFYPSDELYNKIILDFLLIDSEELKSRYPHYIIDKFTLKFNSDNEVTSGVFDISSNHLFSIHSVLIMKPDFSKWYQSIITKGEIVINDVDPDFKDTFDKLKKTIGILLNVDFPNNEELSLSVKGKLSFLKWELLKK